MPGGRQHRGRAIVAVAQAGLLLAGLLLAGCGGSREPQVAPATVEPAPPSPTASPEPEPTPDDPYAVPEVIDEEYLNRVFEALEAVIGDATRIIVAEKMYPPEADDLLMTVYGPDALQVVRDGWIDELVLDPQLGAWHATPDDKHVEVRSILHATSECVFVETSWDLTGVLQEPSGERVYIVLRRDEPTGPNPTPWVVERQAQLADGREVGGRNLCEP